MGREKSGKPWLVLGLLPLLLSLDSVPSEFAGKAEAGAAIWVFIREPGLSLEKRTSLPQNSVFNGCTCSRGPAWASLSGRM